MTKRKPIRLSFSAIDTYLSCPKKYKLERIDWLMEDKLSTPLFFGSAIDDASELIFLEKLQDKSKRKPFDRDEMIDRFTEKLSNTRFQGKDVFIPTFSKVGYSKADMQPELLEDEDVKDFEDYLESKDLAVDNVFDFIEYIKSIKNPTEDEIEIYNYICWKSVYRKGIMMLDALKVWSDENIKEVISIQRRIQVVNEEEDTLTGYLDLEAVMMDGVERTLDLKTASNANAQYPDDCIKDAMQLHIYSQEAFPKVGYVILDKMIRKREPRARVREVYGEVTDEMLDSTFDTIDEVLHNIMDKEFPKNMNSCYRYGKCGFYNLCHNGSKKGLVKKVYDPR